jgi:hypothetical protein
VHLGAGVALIVAGSLVGLITVFVLWHRIPTAVALITTSVCGMSLAAGGLLVQEDVAAASWAFALGLLAILAPAHARLVFGRPGRPPGPVVAGAASAA